MEVDDTKALKKKLEALAATVNLFKSEAVQLRVVDALLGEIDGEGQGSVEHVTPKSKKNETGTPKQK